MLSPFSSRRFPASLHDIPSPVYDPLEPTAAPSRIDVTPFFTPSPTDEDSIAVELPSFALEYDVPNLRQSITRLELEALEAATRLYLEDYFLNELEDNSFTILDDFITELLKASFVEGIRIEVDYLSTSRFNPFSTIIPSNLQLNSALIEAFSGLNILDYEAFLNDELNSDNIFFGSTVFFVQAEEEDGD